MQNWRFVCFDRKLPCRCLYGSVCFLKMASSRSTLGSLRNDSLWFYNILYSIQYVLLPRMYINCMYSNDSTMSSYGCTHGWFQCRSPAAKTPATATFTGFIAFCSSLLVSFVCVYSLLYIKLYKWYIQYIYIYISIYI